MDSGPKLTITSVTPAGEKYDRYAALKSLGYIVLVVVLPTVSIAAFVYAFLAQLATHSFGSTANSSDHAGLTQPEVFLIIAAVASLGALVMAAILLLKHRTTGRTILGFIIFVLSGFLMYSEVSFLVGLLTVRTA